MLSAKKLVTATLLLASSTHAWPAPTGEAWNMILDSVAWMDKFYDPGLHATYDLTSTSAMDHETQLSARYALGLLARNGNDGWDAREANEIIKFVIADQFKNPQDLWYGDYTKESDEPPVGSPAYPPHIYASWDPNWRGFVGLMLVTMYEEYPHLLPNSTMDLMLESLYNCSVGDSYRGGGVNGDNLYPAYSNPSIMRAVGTGWTGRKTGDANMTQAGEDYAQEVIDLFDMHGTLSEFNSPTYDGISMYGLTLWGKYMPQDSVLGQRGPDMLASVYNVTSQLWNANMRQLAGPYDRSYTFDMTKTLSLLSFFLAPIVGRTESGLRQYPEVMSKPSDWAWAPSILVHADYFVSVVPQEIQDNFKTFSGEHTWTGHAYYPPHDLEDRNITAWLSENLTIGAESYRCINTGGPPNNQLQFNPAVATWQYEDQGGATIGWLSVRSTETHVTYEITPYQMKIIYPEGNSSSTFEIFVSTSLLNKDVRGWADVGGVDISVTTNANSTPGIQFGGHYGGALEPYYDYNYWQFQHNMTSDFQGTPEFTLKFN